MGLETGTYPSDFVLTNPTAGDPKAQGDDHLRLVKTLVQNALPVGAPVYPLTSGTAQATTSGAAIDFTGIPSWVKRITVMLTGISTNAGGSNAMVQIGDSGGIETSGYLGSATQLAGGTNPIPTAFTTGFGITGGIALTSVFNGSMVLTLLNAATNTWVSSSTVGFSDTAQTHVGGGTKSLSATLDRIRLTTVDGVTTFDAGSVNILYE